MINGQNHFLQYFHSSKLEALSSTFWAELGNLTRLFLHFCNFFPMGNLFGNLWVEIKKCIYWNSISFPLYTCSPSYLPLHKGKWARLKYQGTDKTKGSRNFFISRSIALIIFESWHYCRNFGLFTFVRRLANNCGSPNKSRGFPCKKLKSPSSYKVTNYLISNLRPNQSYLTVNF